MGQEERWLKPSEAAAKLGVSIKALRVYEREGLVTPVRTAAGWRAYGRDEIVRLHQIIVLRDLGMPLKAIGELLAAGPPSLAELLTAQQDALERKRLELNHAISLLADARLRLAQGQPLGPDDLTQLSRETVMTNFETYKALEPRIDGFVAQHVPIEYIQALRREMREQLNSTGLTEPELMAEMSIFLAEARRLMAAGDTDSEAAMRAARRFASLTRGVKKPDPAFLEAWRKGMSEAMADPKLGPDLPFDEALIAFIKRISDNLKAEDELGGDRS